VTHVLVVDDDAHLLRTLRVHLAAHGYTVATADTGHDAIQAATAERPDLIVLDLGLPDIDGTTVITALRSTSLVPIIVLSARTDAPDKVRALDTGADDYVTKPFGITELLARMRAAVRRANQNTRPGDTDTPRRDDNLVQTPAFTVDLAARKVSRDGADLRLTPTEWAILELLVRHRGALVTQRRLLTEVWGPNYRTETNYLRVYLAQLRQKLEPEPARPRYLITEPGMATASNTPPTPHDLPEAGNPGDALLSLCQPGLAQTLVIMRVWTAASSRVALPW
jgi:two-component system KDP operon response regulator KdpE